MAAIRRRYGGALAREMAEGLSRMLEEVLRVRDSLDALEVELDVPAALAGRKSRRRAPGVWAIRVSAARSRDPRVTVEKHEAAAAA